MVLHPLFEALALPVLALMIAAAWLLEARKTRAPRKVQVRITGVAPFRRLHRSGSERWHR